MFFPLSNEHNSEQFRAMVCMFFDRFECSIKVLLLRASFATELVQTESSWAKDYLLIGKTNINSFSQTHKSIPLKDKKLAPLADGNDLPSSSAYGKVAKINRTDPTPSE